MHITETNELSPETLKAFFGGEIIDGVWIAPEMPEQTEFDVEDSKRLQEVIKEMNGYTITKDELTSMVIEPQK